jgi:hypothetical protein
VNEADCAKDRFGADSVMRVAKVHEALRSVGQELVRSPLRHFGDSLG